MYPFLFAIVTGAFLLFLIQPLFAKLILPWFGGSAAVWSAALMFFQVTVLGGYGYTFWLSRNLKPNAQVLVHGVLLVASCAMLPIAPSAEWATKYVADPTFHILALLGMNLGLPCVLLSATSPLQQIWYVRRTGSSAPYRLYAFSSLGSVIALLSFPLLLEPHLETEFQALLWAAIYIVFVCVSIVAGWLSCRESAHVVSETTKERSAGAPNWRVIALWVLYSACASALLIAVTSHLTTNVAPIPLLWVVPLAIYLVTFIVCFGSDRVYNYRAQLPWLISAIVWITYELTATGGALHIKYAIPLYLAGLFLSCMLCHGELARRRPSPKYIAAFYLWASFGGALGGTSIVVVAPSVFDSRLELQVLILVISILGIAPLWFAFRKSHTLLIRLGLVTSIGFLAIYLTQSEITDRSSNVFMSRNFYGVLKVLDSQTMGDQATRSLIHGTVIHGSQRLNGPNKTRPASYYALNSGVGVAVQMLQREGAVRIGVIGLGAGVLAGYARKGDLVRFYEINPDIVFIANEFFTFLSQAQQVGANVDTLIGDGRLTLEMQDQQNYDLLVMDAFSSDAIPTHLLTREAFDLYFKHLKPNGVLAINISNQYIDLESVCVRGGEGGNRVAFVLDNSANERLAVASSKWVLLTARADLPSALASRDSYIRRAIADKDLRVWTDQFSSLWPHLMLNN